jgi:hypothetical protein
MDKKSIICLVVSVVAFALCAAALGTPTLSLTFMGQSASLNIGDKLEGTDELVSLIGALWTFNILLLIGLFVGWVLHFVSKTACQVMGIINLVFAIILFCLACAVIAKINDKGFSVGPAAPLMLVASLLVIAKQLMTNSIIHGMF